MNNDIVARLERLMCSEAGCGDMRIYMTAKLAAAEIQLLREENRELFGKTEELKRDIDRINKSTGMGFAHNHRMMDQLRAERDEARRSVCCGALPPDHKNWKPSEIDAALKLIAAQQFWDCFDEPVSKSYKSDSTPPA